MRIALGIAAVVVVASLVLYTYSEATAQGTPVGSVPSNPHSYGVVFEAGNFDMQITAVDEDAWPEIQAENQFNDPPAAGHAFVMWTVAVENVRGSQDDDEWATDLDFAAIVDGVRLTSYGTDSSCGVIPDDLNADLFLGGKTEGNFCISIPVNRSNIVLEYDSLHTDANGDAFFVKVYFKGFGTPPPTPTPDPAFHPCDTNQDGRIDAAEVLAVVALYFQGLQN